MSKLSGSETLGLLKTGVLALVPSLAEPDRWFGERRVPAQLRQWLARLRLLEGVPFSYLVSDSTLLPLESIRFFFVDRTWTDALVQGALSVGTVSTSDRAQLERLYSAIRDEIDEQERRVRDPSSDETRRGTAGTVTGFLLRSRVVSGWPGLHVRAYSDNELREDEVPADDYSGRMKILRLERLAPAVLLVLIDGVPARIDIEEPRHGIQFGVELEQAQGTSNYTASVTARDVNTSRNVPGNPQMAVHFRAGSPGVLDMQRTAEAFVARADTNMGSTLDSAEFALQMLRFPYRQIFGEPPPSAGIQDWFKPTKGFALRDLLQQFSGPRPEPVVDPTVVRRDGDGG